MADYHAEARTSYAKFDDVEALIEFAKKVNAEVITKEDEEHGTLHGLLFDQGIPSFMVDPETDKEEEIFLEKILGDILSMGWSIVLMEIGRENMRYLAGVAIIISSSGSCYAHRLTDWVSETMSLVGENFTHAEW